MQAVPGGGGGGGHVSLGPVHHSCKSLSESTLNEDEVFSNFETLYRDANQSDFIVFSTTNRAKYDNTILPIKIRFSPNVCLPLSLSLLLMYFLPNNNFSLAFYLASLFGGNPTKIKS